MISSKPTNEDIREYADRINEAYTFASESQRERGRAWYPTANQLATFISDGNTVAGAGVLAALSANKGWEQNQSIAERAFDDGRATGHVSDACRKAERIMNGENPLDVLPTDSKTWNFYRCIVDPTDPDPVVIDRHAHDVAVGEVYGSNDRGLSAKGRYAALAHAYRIAARELGILPQELQAIVWVAHIEREK